jgi:hypothetical protein
MNNSVVISSIIRLDNNGNIKFPNVLERLFQLEYPEELKDYFFIMSPEHSRVTEKIERLKSIAQNRKRIIKAFLGIRPKKDYLLFVDDDQLPPKDIIYRLIELNGDISAPRTNPKNKPELPKTSFNFMRNADFSKVEPSPDYPIQQEIKEIDGKKIIIRWIYFEPPLKIADKIYWTDVVGMFCTLIKRKVLETIVMRYEEGNIVRTGDGQSFDLSEDGLFCLRAIQNKFKVKELNLKIEHLNG